MRVSCTNIKYDADGEKVNLPTSLMFSRVPDELKDNDYELEDWLNEKISNETGWLVLSYEYEVLK